MAGGNFTRGLCKRGDMAAPWELFINRRRDVPCILITLWSSNYRFQFLLGIHTDVCYHSRFLPEGYAIIFIILMVQTGFLGRSRFSEVGREKKESERNNEGGSPCLSPPSFFCARFRSSPTTESLEHANITVIWRFSKTQRTHHEPPVLSKRSSCARKIKHVIGSCCMLRSLACVDKSHTIWPRRQNFFHKVKNGECKVILSLMRLKYE